ncbi:MAG TPA: polysaccharide deacetylase family protein [Kiritimatiellia bacterium]|nr:polysaccharide deacetylase family protein [Kiritimatiellia bacterium]HRZ12357.1 polysaccharide deacetylase family protein [Kiritimatiellia bacterium]HSA17885.1 polysaccharide deacetylase family protein [Kiritimatiellia bacterium]
MKQVATFVLLAAWLAARAQGDCLPPDCIAASTNPPGGLAPLNTPQMILLSWDDSVTTDSYALVQSVLTNHVNPNGQPIKATFFVSLDSRIDYSLAQRLFADGHEIAVHTMTHTTGTNTLPDTWRREIVGCRSTLSALGGIPEAAIVGFRAPYLFSNDGSFRILAERSFLYESSLFEDLAGMSPSPAAMTWAYTLDDGAVENVPAVRQPAQPYPGLFELHLYDLFSTNLSPVTIMDPPEGYDSNAVMNLWKTNFLWHYDGNRAPLTLALHATTTNQWMSNPAHSAWRIAALNDFVEWTLAYPHVYFVAYRDLAAYMRDPVDVSAAPTAAVFQTARVSPQTNLSACAYPGYRTLRVIGGCPPAYPAPTNLYWQFAPTSGGTVAFNVISQDATHTYAYFVVTNDTAGTIYHWNTAVDISAGQVSWLWDGFWTQTLAHLDVHAKQYNRILAPGGSATVTFRLDTTNPVLFTGASVALDALAPATPTLATIRPDAGSSRVALAWDRTALEYELHAATQLVGEGWGLSATGVFTEAWTGEVAAPGPVFLRVGGRH